MSVSDVRVWPGRPGPMGATWDGSGTNFTLFSAHAEKVELCLFDDERQDAKSSGSDCRNTRMRSGMATCRTCGRVNFMAIGYTDRTNPRRATASTITSCSSTPTPKRSSARLNGTTPCSATGWATTRRICPSTIGTVRLSFRNAGSSTLPSPGDGGRINVRGTKPSSTKCTPKGSRCATRRSAMPCAAPSQASRRHRS